MSCCDRRNDCCERDGKFDNLCAECAKIRDMKSHKIWVENVRANEICSQNVDTKNLNTETEVANDICAQSITGKSVFSESSFTNSLCAQSGSIDSLCVNNLQVANPLQTCIQYRFTAIRSSNLLYTLGTDLVFDMVLDDPNNNFNPSLGQYTIPKSGYYTIEANLVLTNLSTSDILAGIPVASLELYVNGLAFKIRLEPWLSFSLNQSSAFSIMLPFNAGDVLSVQYEILFQNPASGVSSVVGTMTGIGNGTLAGSCSFSGILHSELCLPPSGIQCPPCPVVAVGCTPFVVPCEPLPDQGMCADMDADDDDDDAPKAPAPVRPASVSLSQPVKAQAAMAACAPCAAPTAPTPAAEALAARKRRG